MWSFRSKDNKQLPTWIASLPFERDRQTVVSLLQAGAKLDEPREMIFCVYASKESAVKIQNESKRYGWNCTVSKSANPNAGKLAYFLELKQTGYALNLKNFMDDKTSIQSLVEKYGAEYDGWYASV